MYNGLRSAGGDNVATPGRETSKAQKYGNTIIVRMHNAGEGWGGGVDCSSATLDVVLTGT